MFYTNLFISSTITQSVPHVLLNGNEKHTYSKYIIGEFNLNGIKSLVNPYNEHFKKYLLSCFYFDVFIFLEQHCLPNEQFEIENFKIFQNNRPAKTGHARRGSGGIAIAINVSVFETHTLASVVKGVDGQIYLKL